MAVPPAEAHLKVHAVAADVNCLHQEVAKSSGLWIGISSRLAIICAGNAVVKMISNNKAHAMSHFCRRRGGQKHQQEQSPACNHL